MDQAKYDNITNALASWIAKNCRPISIVTDEGLQDLLRTASGNGFYKLPSRQVIDTRIASLYSLQKAKVQLLLDNATYVSLTADYWSSVANDSYLGVTAHVLDRTWELKSFALAVRHVEERHYSDACSRHFTEVATNWGILDKVTTLSTDNARNMVAAVSQTRFQHMPCFAHSLQLTVNKALVESGVDNTLSKCRKIVGHFKHSPSNNNELKLEQRRLTLKEEALIQDVATRWNSTLLMIQRLVANKEPVLATLLNPDHRHNLQLLSDAEWDKLRVIQALLEPSRYATELLGGEKYVSCSVVLPMICHLLLEMKTLEDDPPYVIRFKNAFIADLNARKQSCNLKWLQIATALDPRFKLLKCVPKEEREAIWSEVQVLVEDCERNVHSQNHQATTDSTGKQVYKVHSYQIYLL